MSWRTAFGERLRDLRQEHGWASQEASAHYFDMDRTYGSSVERGRRNLTLDVIVRLARGLDVTPAELLSTTE